MLQPFSNSAIPQENGLNLNIDVIDTNTIIESIAKEKYQDAARKFNRLPNGSNKLRDIILEAIEILDNNGVELIVEFLEHIPSERVRGYGIILDELKTKKQLGNVALMTMAYRMDGKECEKTQAHELVRKSIPDFILKFPFDRVITMMDTHWSTLIFASSHLIDGNRRQVFGNKGGRGCQESFCAWTLIPHNNGRYYQLKSGYGEFLYAESHKCDTDHERRNVYTTNIDRINSTLWNHNLWQFEPVPESWSFRLKNVGYDEYLYVAFDGYDFDGGNNRLFLWIPKGCDGKNCRFTVSSV